MQQGFFVTYSHVYRYDDILKENSREFPKSPNVHISADLMARNRDGLSCNKQKHLYCKKGKRCTKKI